MLRSIGYQSTIPSETTQKQGSKLRIYRGHCSKKVNQKLHNPFATSLRILSACIEHDDQKPFAPQNIPFFRPPGGDMQSTTQPRKTGFHSLPFYRLTHPSHRYHTGRIRTHASTVMMMVVVAIQRIGCAVKVSLFFLVRQRAGVILPLP